MPLATQVLSLPISSPSPSLSSFSNNGFSKPSPFSSRLHFHRPSSAPSSYSLQRNSVCGFTRKTRARKPTSLFYFVPRALSGSAIEDEFSVLTSITSNHNDIIILDTPNSRILLLDSTHNIHSIYNKGQKWTGSYWDEFSSLPAIVPQGPIAILGLGGGTAAHLMLDLWPSLKLEGWDIDQILIDKAREYLGLSDLEQCTDAGGFLHVHVGDALSPSATVEGGFAGIVVDLFSDGKVLPQLQEVETWIELNRKLMPHGRVMVNCGAAHPEESIIGDEIVYSKVSSNDDAWVQNATIRAMWKAFTGNLSWKRMAKGESDNFLALTGPTPDLSMWLDAVPAQLRSSVKQWRPCTHGCGPFLISMKNTRVWAAFVKSPLFGGDHCYVTFDALRFWFASICAA